MRNCCGSSALIAENQLIRGCSHEGLLKFAFTDYLTGLRTRGYFEQQLDLEIKRAERKGSFLSLLMVDIDRFKLLNDQCGHHVGDQVLREVASRSADETCAISTPLARYGRCKLTRECKTLPFGTDEGLSPGPHSIFFRLNAIDERFVAPPSLAKLRCSRTASAPTHPSAPPGDGDLSPAFQCWVGMREISRVRFTGRSTEFRNQLTEALGATIHLKQDRNRRSCRIPNRRTVFFAEDLAEAFTTTRFGFLETAFFETGAPFLAGLMTSSFSGTGFFSGAGGGASSCGASALSRRSKALDTT